MKACKVEGCDRSATSKKMCGAHYKRAERGTSLHTPIKKMAPKGTGYIDSNGYHRTANKKTHRIVMEEVLGRELAQNEHVHHLNGNRLDNRLENLELWVTHQPRGQRVNDQIEWACEILRIYAPEKLKEDE